MVKKLHRTYYRNKKRVKHLYAAIAMSVFVFVVTPGWVFTANFHL
jgi:hypothetical protein